MINKLKKKGKLPIFQELTLGSLAIILVILIVYTGVQLIGFTFFIRDYEKDLLKNQYANISSLMRDENIGMSKKEFESYLNRISFYSDEDDENYFIRIYSKEGELIYKNDDIKERNLYLNEGKVKVKTKFIGFKPYDVLSGPIKIENKGYIIEIIKNIDVFKDFIENYFYGFLGTLIFAAILSILGAMYVSRNFLKRLNKLTDTMIEIKNNGFHERAYVSKENDEFDRVNIIFNSMMDDVEENLEKQKRFVSDASHELKTPLTALQGHLSMLKRWGKNDEKILNKSLDICLNEVDRLKKIVNDMLLLSRVEKEEIDINNLKQYNPRDLILETLENYKILNEKLIYSLKEEDDFEINMKEEHLKQLLIIFMDNAIKYNDKEKIKIDINLFSFKGEKILTIRDNGIGIPEESINKVTNRFYKVDESRFKNNSFGLGLSIAKRIIKLYNGKLYINSKLGEFTEIKIIF